MSSREAGNDNDVREPLLAPVHASRKEAGIGGYREKISIDAMLRDYCGEFGPWQMRHFVLTSLAWALEAFHTMVVIFADREPEGGCPGAGSSWGLADGGSSTVTEWGLVCGEKYKVGLVQAVFFTGCMIGAGVFGHLSDSFLGRKGSLMVVCVLNAVFGCLTAFSPHYYVYCLLRFLTGFSTGGVGMCSFVLSTEPVGPSKRGVAGMSTFYFFSCGIAALSGLAYIFRSWRELYIVSSIPSLLFLVAVLPFLSESPRWYLVRGRIGEAMKLMRNIATVNGNVVPDSVILGLDEEVEEDMKEDENHADNKDAVTGSVVDVVKSPLTRFRLLLAVSINFLCSVVYYGISLNVTNLKTNLYLSVFLNAMAEVPAFLITALLLDKFGRKPLAVWTQWFSGLFCLMGCLVTVTEAWKGLRMACGVLGIFGMAGTYNLLFIYTTELFPTVVRNVALGCATQAAQMGAILAPLVVVLGGGIPFAIFSASAILGGLLAFHLPETLNRPLYDTISGMEGGETVC
ncbi:hypothetical protein MLD38_000520 [Melastoma candidum]|uniref:Uncharacterized protein n=1 Tax=Melastoma candidum TaxID=119954 RepID=A0ACB9SAE6_9MYRT|nr:hypothetical protein MLD38_000520 [Melastoma candidum]